MAIKMVPNFFKVIFDGEYLDLFSLDENAYVLFSSDATNNGIGIFTEINENYIPFPYIDPAPYALTLRQKQETSEVRMTEDHVDELERQLNEMVLKDNPEFAAKLNRLLTLFNGVVCTTTQLFLQNKDN
jgi:hypothetical protein